MGKRTHDLRWMELRCSECQKVNTWPKIAFPLASLWSVVPSGHSCIPKLCASSSISSTKGSDSERLCEEKNHSGQGHSRDTAENSTNWIKFYQLWGRGARELSGRLEVRGLALRLRCRHSCVHLYCLQSSDKENIFFYTKEWSLIAWGIEIEGHAANILGPWPLRNYLECSIRLFLGKC